ncbi:MAG: flagellar basal body rod protein FlgC [Myxococcota bacterium]
MDLLDTFNIAASGLTAQRVRVQTISSNLANARTTRTADGGPYKRQAPVFRSQAATFGSVLDRTIAGVQVDRIAEIDDLRMVFDPRHPDADAEGFVAMPDIDVIGEMVDLMSASRSYEAALNAVDTTREMAMRALEIGR